MVKDFQCFNILVTFFYPLEACRPVIAEAHTSLPLYGAALLSFYSIVIGYSGIHMSGVKRQVTCFLRPSLPQGTLEWLAEWIYPTIKLMWCPARLICLQYVRNVL